jgi:mannose-1-phosphate guanylyltransferase / phosphomannomutase
MKAVIMAGGFGTRLRPLTMNIPKPMIPVMNKPMMHHIVDLLRDHGITDIVTTLYFQPDAITNYFGDGSKFGVNMVHISATEDYGTAGSVKNAEEYLDERFIIISGDVLTDIDITDAVRFHDEKKSLATIILTHAVNPLQFGIVITDADNRIVRFLEKPSWGEVFSDTINTGIYIIEPEILDMMPPKEERDWSNNIFPQLLREKKALYGYVANGYWRDIGNLNEYQEAHLDALRGDVKVPYLKTPGNMLIGTDTIIQTDKKNLHGSIILGDNVQIHHDVRLSNVVIGNNTVIEQGSVITNSVLWDNTYVGPMVQISSSVVGSKTSIGESAVIDDNVFISDECKIGKRARLFSNIKLWPNKEVEDGASLSRSLVQEDKWLRELFADARITGISNIEMNPEFGAKLGTAYGMFIGQGKVVATSRDSDNVSRMMNRALICGLISAGVTVNDLRSTPIPMVRHALSAGKEVGGFHVRKSPFDKNLTDIIFFDEDGRDLLSKQTKKIDRLFFGEDVHRPPQYNVGSINFPERVTESYQQRFQEHLDFDLINKAKFRIVVDYSNGSAATIFPNILGRIKIQVVSLNAYLDPHRLTRDKSEFDHALSQLSHIVTSLKYDAGFMIDAGGEKIFVVDENGHVFDAFDAERLLILVAKLFLMTHPDTKKIAVPVTTSNVIFEIAEEHGVEVILTKNSHLAMMEAAHEHPVQFVGGTKGGFIFPDFLFATDGMFAVTKILEMMAKAGVHIGELNRQIPEYYTVKRNIKCAWEAKGRVMRNLMKDSEQFKRELIDGVKIHIDDQPTTVILIPDKERPLFHVNIESPDKNRCQQLLEEYEQKIITWRDSDRGSK